MATATKPTTKLRGFTKPRNRLTLQTRQSGNLPFNFGGMIKRSMPPRFKAPCSSDDSDDSTDSSDSDYYEEPTGDGNGYSY